MQRLPIRYFRPIETAPLDRDVLLFCPTEEPQQVVGYFCPKNDVAPEYWAPREEVMLDMFGEVSPTHWCELIPDPDLVLAQEIESLLDRVRAARDAGGSGLDPALASDILALLEPASA